MWIVFSRLPESSLLLLLSRKEGAIVVKAANLKGKAEVGMKRGLYRWKLRALEARRNAR
jgi:hypothetical protein